MHSLKYGFEHRPKILVVEKHVLHGSAGVVILVQEMQGLEVIDWNRMDFVLAGVNNALKTLRQTCCRI